MISRFREWGRRNASVLSVLGALVIFFSWAVTTTLADRYTRLKQSVEAAHSTFRLYTTLNGLRDQINSVAIELIQNKVGTNASRIAAGRTGDEPLDSLRREFELAVLSGHQITELMDFAVETAAVSRASADASATHREIEDVRTKIESIYKPARELRRLAEAQNNQLRPGEPIVKVNGSSDIDRYVAYIRRDAVPRVAELYRLIVELSNRRREETTQELRKAQDRAELSASVALALYVLGSLLALGGQFFDKIDKTPKVASEGDA